MNFVSFAFVFLFLAALTVRLLNLPKGIYLWSLISLSSIFYAWQRPVYIWVIYGIAIFDYFTGIWIDLRLGSRPATPHSSGYSMALFSIIANTSLLAYFKYRSLIVSGLNSLWSDFLGFPPLGGGAGAGDIKKALPLGVSFHTFQGMAYNIDIARRVQRPTYTFRDFAFIVLFFPQLVAGPIVRARQFLYQISRKRPLRWVVFGEGLYLMAKGYFFKCALGDNFG